MVEEADLEALSVLIIEREGGCPEDEGLAMQHVVLPDHDLHKGLAPTEVQEGAPANMQPRLLALSCSCYVYSSAYLLLSGACKGSEVG